MQVDCRDLHELIQRKYRRHRDDRKFPDEGRQHTQRYHDAPQSHAITDHAELRVPARRENAADNGGIQ